MTAARDDGWLGLWTPWLGTGAADPLADCAAACESATRELWAWQGRGADAAGIEDFARRFFAAGAGRSFGPAGSGSAAGAPAAAPAFPAPAFPALGWTREHQGRWQAWQCALVNWRVAHAAWLALLAPAAARGAALLAGSVARSPAATPRELFDRWIDCAERAWRELAHEAAYLAAQGALVRAALELISRQQELADQAARALGLPTRAELDTVHRTLHEMRRARERDTTEAGRERSAAGSAPERQ